MKRLLLIAIALTILSSACFAVTASAKVQTVTNTAKSAVASTTDNIDWTGTYGTTASTTAMTVTNITKAVMNSNK